MLSNVNASILRKGFAVRLTKKVIGLTAVLGLLLGTVTNTALVSSAQSAQMSGPAHVQTVGYNKRRAGRNHRRGYKPRRGYRKHRRGYRRGFRRGYRKGLRRGYRSPRYYGGYYRNYRYDYTPQVLGIIGGVVQYGIEVERNRQIIREGNPYQRHVGWCYSKYKTYREGDNSFMSYDGYRKLCVSPWY